MKKITLGRMGYKMAHFGGLGALTALLLGIAASAAGGQAPPREDPPYVPTPDRVVELMLNTAKVGPGDLVYDLGSGDGRLVIAAAMRGAEAVGVEYEGWLVERSWSAADSAGVRDRVRFIEGDIFEVPFDEASVVMLYLSPEFNLRLRPRLLTELEPGTLIVSHAFHMGDWAPDTMHTVGSGAARTTVYGWTVPADVDGFWSVEGEGMDPFRLELNQSYQRLSGKALIEGGEVPVFGSLDGASVELRTAGLGEAEAVFRGQIVDGRMSGVLLDGQGMSLRTTAMRFSDPALAPSGVPDPRE